MNIASDKDHPFIPRFMVRTSSHPKLHISVVADFLGLQLSDDTNLVLMLHEKKWVPMEKFYEDTKNTKPLLWEFIRGSLWLIRSLCLVFFAAPFFRLFSSVICLTPVLVSGAIHQGPRFFSTKVPLPGSLRIDQKPSVRLALFLLC